MYMGPDFFILDERLQFAFIDYLRVAGVNEDVMMIIEHIAQEKEQDAYVKWINDMKNFNKE